MEERILQWIGDYCLGRLDEKEAGELRDWLDASADNLKAFALGVSEVKIYNALLSKDRITGTFGAVVRKYGRSDRRKMRLRRIAAAVVFVAVLSVAATRIMDRPGNHQEQRITPGTTKALLELADGTLVDLTCGNLGEIAARDGSFSVDEERGTILYGAVVGRESKDEPAFHSITVPIGAEYHFTLPDGTKVWLNSDSRITYPNIFEGATRNVRLCGEAYFDVTGDADRPFVVEFSAARLEVKGTRFSVSAYPEFSRATATLEEGGVEISFNGSGLTLAPGMQAVVDKSRKSLTSRQVDTRLYTSWVRGIFEYENMKLSEITVQLSRWYDVDFHFTEQGAAESRFTGVVIKYHDLNEALALIEKTSDVGFIIDGRKITVTKK